MGKGKKGAQKQPQGQQKKPQAAAKKQQAQAATPAQAQAQAQKNKQTQQIMNAITNMDLDSPDFIDVKAFQQSKAILVNALDELELYIGYFNKGDYEKFGKPAQVDAK